MIHKDGLIKFQGKQRLQDDFAFLLSFSKIMKNSLQKQAYSNKLKIIPPKNENFQIKFMTFLIFLLKT